MNRYISLSLCVILILILSCSIFRIAPLKDADQLKYYSAPEFHNLKLIPLPQTVEFREGYFMFEQDVSIFLSNPNNKDDKFSARQLVTEIEDKFSYQTRVENNVENCAIHLCRIDNELKKEMKINDKINSQIGEEGYVLNITSDNIFVVANSAKGIFYGTQTLKQLIRANLTSSKLRNLKIVDWPTLKYRGWQDDISRGPIPTLNFMKDEIRKMSECKQNMFTLYTEHVFKFKKHPKIAPDDGITREEVNELVDFARKYHVEVVGNFQSFGHFAKILEVPEYAHLAETPHIITPAKEESYKFLNEVFSEIAPIYESKLFNINCDETFGLGTGPAKTMVDSIGKEGTYAYHINRVYDLLKPYNKRLMMWGDIAAAYPGIIPQLPKDLIVLSWGYHPGESFDQAILPFTKMDFEFMICPGVSCWRVIWPNFNDAIINISNYVRDGARLGAMGMLNTSWDDDGENLFNYNWYLLAWGAECSWNTILPVAEQEMQIVREKRLHFFNQGFDPIFFKRDGSDITNLMHKLSQLRNYQSSGNLSDNHFWKNMLDDKQNIHDLEKRKVDATELETISKEIVDEIKAITPDVKQNSEVLEYARFAANRVRVLAQKEQCRMKIQQLIKKSSNNNHEQADQFKVELADLSNEVLILKDEYEKLWHKENRLWWLDTNLVKYDQLAQNIKNITSQIIFIPDDNIFNDERYIKLTTLFENNEIYFTVDDSEPNIYSPQYLEPIKIVETVTIKARIVKDHVLHPVFEREFYVYKGDIKNITLTNSYSKKYSANGIISLVDGIKGSDNYRDGSWLGYEYDDLDCVMDFGISKQINKIAVGCFQSVAQWIFHPGKIEYFISDNGVDFKLIESVVLEEPQKSDHPTIQYIEKDFMNIQTKYLKVKVHNIKTCPEWHNGAGGKAWLFVDEIEIN